ncbi:Protein of unknown function (DUF3016) [Idiomarina sp. A28L]|uniref:DUF3016 domain-containing protein n=1 Tax=Idiomarina sp. A28L TaxID=1036674 RepID=UPI0002138A97|nr:DUF3016 domain-containing protein [Idiomarina sp. A28L]EGN75317.1 Protein of unknown function (DUF3016) [Idiomarina sp. A28L]
MLRLVSIAMAAGLMLPLHAIAAEVEVTWHEPGSYKDIRSGEGNQERYQKRIMEAFDAKFSELASKLPEDQRLHITVTDVDLAGSVVLRDVGGTMQEYRIIENMDYPYMELSYTLYDADGHVVLQAEKERIRGNQVPGQGLSTAERRRGSNLIEYESAMLDRWFRNTFEQNEE